MRRLMRSSGLHINMSFAEAAFVHLFLVYKPFLDTYQSIRVFAPKKLLQRVNFWQDFIPLQRFGRVDLFFMGMDGGLNLLLRLGA